MEPGNEHTSLGSELDHRIAREVMGWKLLQHGESAHWRTPGNEIAARESWSPTTSLFAFARVFSRVKRPNTTLDVRYRIEFNDWYALYGAGGIDVEADGCSLLEAACKAVYAWYSAYYTSTEGEDHA